MPARAWRCLDLTDDEIEAALVSKEATGALLAEMARVARPGEGAEKMIFVVARASREKHRWTGGPVMVQLARIGDRLEKTEMRVAYDRGGGVLVALFAKLLVDTPLAEIEQAVRAAPSAIAPLKLYAQPDGRVVLAPNKRLSAHALPVIEMPRGRPVLDFSALERPKKDRE